MSEYKGIKGFQVQTRTENPGPTEAQMEILYNSTSGQFKTVNTGGAPIGTWASGGNMNTGRSDLAGAGTQTAFSYWWKQDYSWSKHHQQKNIMELLGLKWEFK